MWTYKKKLPHYPCCLHCIAKKVMKTCIAKNLYDFHGNKQDFFETWYLLKSPTNGKGHHLHGTSLEVVMNIFITLALPNCYNFVSGMKRFVWSEWAPWILPQRSKVIRVSNMYMVVVSQTSWKDKVCILICMWTLWAVVWNKCRLERAWRTHGSCSTMWNGQKIRWQWCPMWRIVSIVKCLWLCVVICNPKMELLRFYF